MAKCPKCSNTSFEAEMLVAKNLNIQTAIIKCSACETAIGVIDIDSFTKTKEIHTAIKR